MSEFRFLNVFMSNFCLLVFPRRPLGLTGIYKIDIGVFLHAGKMAGTIR